MLAIHMRNWVKEFAFDSCNNIIIIILNWNNMNLKLKKKSSINFKTLISYWHNKRCGTLVFFALIYLAILSNLDELRSLQEHNTRKHSARSVGWSVAGETTVFYECLFKLFELINENIEAKPDFRAISESSSQRIWQVDK